MSCDIVLQTHVQPLPLNPEKPSTKLTAVVHCPFIIDKTAEHMSSCSYSCIGIPPIDLPSPLQPPYFPPEPTGPRPDTSPENVPPTPAWPPSARRQDLLACPAARPDLW
jgi:hypothetical protein